jgi:hypothetical protein
VFALQTVLSCKGRGNGYDKKENGKRHLNTPNLRSKFHPFSTKRGITATTKVENGFEGFCAYALLHAE